jgi:GH25 family lysozyme M1 (1,4-beta-N-acetylmuramidase)
MQCAGQDAASQVTSMYNYLDSYNATDKYGQIWMDIETNPSDGCGWSDDQDSNCAFIGQLLAASESVGKKPGIYASAYMWSTIAGDGCTVGANYPLWYAHYDDNPSFSDFSSFGGWGTPAMKQYSDQGGDCGVNADLNWYP